MPTNWSYVYEDIMGAWAQIPGQMMDTYISSSVAVLRTAGIDDREKRRRLMAIVALWGGCWIPESLFYS